MTCDIQAAGTIELYFYGDLPPDERATVQAHLKQCVACRHALQDLGIIRAALASRPDVATPPGGDWSGFMERLQGAVAQDVRDAGAPVPTNQPTARVLRMPVRSRVIAALATAAMLTLVTMSVRQVTRNREVPAVDDVRETTPPPATSRASSGEADPELVSLSGAHFERSKLVVLGLATKDSSAPGAGDWSYERDLATSLLRDTRLYRVAAEERGLNRLAGVMRDLELVLLQTSMSAEPDTASLEQLQRLIRRRDLITKMNTVAMAGP